MAELSNFFFGGFKFSGCINQQKHLRLRVAKMPPPKRKRSGEPTLKQKIEKLQDEIFKALKAAKGFERQRLSKRQRDVGVPQEKQQRLEREIGVLKVRLQQYFTH